MGGVGEAAPPVPFSLCGPCTPSPPWSLTGSASLCPGDRRRLGPSAAQAAAAVPPPGPTQVGLRSSALWLIHTLVTVTGLSGPRREPGAAMGGSWGCSRGHSQGRPGPGVGVPFPLCDSVVSPPNLSGTETGSLTPPPAVAGGWYVSALGTGGSRSGLGSGIWAQGLARCPHPCPQMA